MVSFVKAIRAIAYIALLLALMGAASPQAPMSVGTNGSVTIADPGGSDRSGFLIVVEPSGSAWALDGAGHTSGYLQPPLAAALFADLAAAGPLNRLPNHACDEILVIGWNGLRSPNLGCSADPREAKLAADVLSIQRALYVQSYRTTGSLAIGSAGSSSYSSAGYNIARPPAPSYTQAGSAGPASYGTNSLACSCSTAGQTQSLVQVGGSGFRITGLATSPFYFSNGLNGDRFTTSLNRSDLTGNIGSARGNTNLNASANFGNNGDLHSSTVFNNSPGLSGGTVPGSAPH